MSVARSAAALVTLSLLCAASARAADPAAGTYDRLVVVTRAGHRTEARGGTLGATGLTATSNAGAPITVPLENIKTLYVADGSQAGVMALCGAGVGLALSLSAAVNLGSAWSSRDQYGPALLVGGAAAGGALIGALIGSQMTIWRVEPVVVPGKQYALQLSFKM